MHYATSFSLTNQCERWVKIWAQGFTDTHSSRVRPNHLFYIAEPMDLSWSIAPHRNLSTFRLSRQMHEQAVMLQSSYIHFTKIDCFYQAQAHCIKLRLFVNQKVFQLCTLSLEEWFQRTSTIHSIDMTIITKYLTKLTKIIKLPSFWWKLSFTLSSFVTRSAASITFGVWLYQNYRPCYLSMVLYFDAVSMTLYMISSAYADERAASVITFAALRLRAFTAEAFTFWV